MKKLFLFSFLTFFLSISLVTDVEAQRGKKKKKSSKNDEYFDESGNFTSKLWYGLNVGNLGGFNNSFNINLSPMAGYKLLPNLSVGAITKFNYYYENLGNTTNSNGQNIRVTLSALDFSYGVFTRYKFFDVAFVSAEIENSRFKRLRNGILQIDNDGKVLTETRQEPYLYVGGGYSSSNGVWGYELALFYNVLDDATYSRIPWDFRIGITYKF